MVGYNSVREALQVRREPFECLTKFISTVRVPVIVSHLRSASTISGPETDEIAIAINMNTGETVTTNLAAWHVNMSIH